MGLFNMIKIMADRLVTFPLEAAEGFADEHMRLAAATVISATVSRYIELAQSLAHNRAPRMMTVYDFPMGLQPSLSFRRFVHRFAKYTRGCVDSFTLALYYVGRLVDGGRAPLDTSSCYRVFTGCFVIAAKFLDDIPHSNKHIAKVAGLETREVNAIERETLHLLDFNLAVDALNPQWCMFHNAIFKWAAISFRECHSEPAPTDPALANAVIDEEAVKRAWYLDYQFKHIIEPQQFAQVFQVSQEMFRQSSSRLHDQSVSEDVDMDV